MHLVVQVLKWHAYIVTNRNIYLFEPSIQYVRYYQYINLTRHPMKNELNFTIGHCCRHNTVTLKANTVT